jgi:hypothetical protein
MRNSVRESLSQLLLDRLIRLHSWIPAPIWKRKVLFDVSASSRLLHSADEDQTAFFVDHDGTLLRSIGSP